MRRSLFYSVVLIFQIVATPVSLSAQSGGVAAAEPTFRAVRSASGTKGSVQSGRYVIEDPRTVFYVPEDKQIIVYFEWEGPAGHHKFEGLWKNPSGKVTVISDFAFEADQKRFGGYWTLLTNETMPTGLWTLEARVDGESAGSYQFQILAAARPAGMDAATVRVPLSTAKMYQHLLSSSVTIQRLDSSGRKLGTGLGFVLGEGFVATAFHSIDGASTLVATFPDGRTAQISEVASFNRRQDWAVLRVDHGATPALKRAPAGTWAVGDRCYLLDVVTEGNRTIAETSITGTNTFPGAGERLNVNHFYTRASRGGALVNEYGELIGIVGGDLIPGSSVTEGLRWGVGMIESVQATGGGLAVPIRMVSLSGAQSTTLAAMLSAGHFTPPLAGYEHVLNGTTSRNVNRQFGMPSGVDYTTEFSRKDKQILIVLNFLPKQKLKGALTFRMFDIENRPLGTSKPRKLDLRANEMSYIDFAIPPDKMSPGIYRIDAFLDETPMWRSFFKVTD